MKINRTLLVVEIAWLFGVIGVVLFWAAGTVRWATGWAFLLIFFACTVALTLWLIKNNPALLTERMTGLGKADQKGWDKLFAVLANVLFMGWLILMPLDAVRFGWSQMPDWLQWVGALLLIFSFYLFFLVFRENSFLSPAVRIQSEREQAVVSTGLYSVVRHPMYATVIFFATGTTLLLGSWYGFLPALALMVAVGWRAVQEERTLRAELPGYDAYMAQVKYRLIPYVW